MWLAWRRSPDTNSLMRYSFTVFLPLAVVILRPDGSKLRGKAKMVWFRRGKRVAARQVYFGREEDVMEAKTISNF